MNGIGGSGDLARTAIEAALKRQAEALARIKDQIPSAPGQSDAAAGQAVEGPNFRDSLADGLRQVDAEIQKVERLPEDMIAGRVQDVHEIAFQLQKAQLSYDFALQVRNKLIEAYREVMRMGL